MNEKTKNKVITILGFALFCSVAYNIWWVGYEREQTDGNITELTRGSELDFSYINKIADVSSGYYDMWQSCNNTLSDDLQGELSDAELQKFINEYKDQTVSVKKLEDELMEMKKQRSEEIANFRFVRVENKD